MALESEQTLARTSSGLYRMAGAGGKFAVAADTAAGTVRPWLDRMAGR